MIDPVFHRRQTHSMDLIEKLRSEISQMEALQDWSQLCIYATGSYGRLEASPYSDLDLFFVHPGMEGSNSIPKLTKTLIDAELIQLSRKLELPDFSGDGQYLQVHYLEDIIRVLGSPEDDYHNAFTARLLLLLESRPLFNQGFYQEAIHKVIETYYRDYHDHEKNFRPIFLVNDIIRFWRTLCLNYEHRRHRSVQTEKKNANHLKNLKLKFSRMLTCFSGILIILTHYQTPEQVNELVHMTPLERLQQIAREKEGSQKIQEIIEKIHGNYAWFLEQTEKPKEQQMEWIADRAHRDAAFRRAREFGNIVYDLLLQVTDREAMRYLVV